jgi:hypothetical protein
MRQRGIGAAHHDRLPIFGAAGAIARGCIERIEPTNATMPV